MDLLDRIAWINQAPWKPVPLLGLVGAAGFVAYIAYWTWSGDGWVPLVDSANFAVHEAGHPLTALFSGRLAVYGGTVAQLLFPAVCMLEFWRRRWTVSYALCAIWLGQSLLNVARYVADARAMQLPLAGFSDHPLHDWNLILSRWGLLQQDLVLATGLRVVAWLGIAAGLGFLAYRRWDESGERPGG
jgi:hypothetical protein